MYVYFAYTAMSCMQTNRKIIGYCGGFLIAFLQRGSCSTSVFFSVLYIRRRVAGDCMSSECIAKVYTYTFIQTVIVYVLITVREGFFLSYTALVVDQANILPCNKTLSFV